MIYTVTLNPAIDRELTVPAVEFDVVLRASEARVDAGGKGFNVSRVLKGLGAGSTAVGFLAGRAGRQLQEELLALGVAGDFVWADGETRTNISIVTPGGGRHIKVNEQGPTIQLEQQAEMLEKIAGLAQPGDWWVLAGSLPPGLAPDFYARVISVLNQRGALAVLDAAGEPLRLGCAERPYLVKPNAEEAHALTGLPVGSLAETAAVAARLRRMGARNVVISLGKAGALLRTEAETACWARSPEIQEKNPIGAGDSLVGGLVWALARGLSIHEALGWGVASGAATASLSGTTVGSRELIEQLRARVVIEPALAP